jgi:hypothetical protein
MFRLLGFLLGSAASIGVMVWLLGVPRLEVGNPKPETARFEEGSGKPGEGQRAMSIPPPSAEVANPREAQEGTVPASAGEAAQPLPEQRWHVFWSPFRSEIAARGFVARLESVTELDYRIAKVKTGVYQVSFAYGSDAELDSKLSQIRAATGLELQRP